MRYMLMFKTDQQPKPGETACKEHIPEMARLMTELREKGIVLSTEALQPSDSGAKVSYKAGDIRVTDGPFAEAKELVAGFAIVNVNSKAEAVELARKFLTIAGGGESEVLEVVER